MTVKSLSSEDQDEKLAFQKTCISFRERASLDIAITVVRCPT